MYSSCASFEYSECRCFLHFGTLRRRTLRNWLKITAKLCEVSLYWCFEARRLCSGVC